MLHAFTHKKSSLHRRYLARKQREPSEDRVTQEDEVTSNVLGTLEFLPESSVAVFWSHLVPLHAPSFDLPVGDATGVSMSFWPSRGRLQPDLLVKLKWGREIRLLLVEIKWRSELSGEDQLHKQWLSFLSSEERAVALHIFIGIETAQGIKARSRKDVWHGRLLLLSWMQVINTVHLIRNADSPQLHSWARHVIYFLRLVGIAPFMGFQRFPPPELPVHGGPIFWKGSHGVIRLLAPDVPEMADKSIFFHTDE